MRHEDKEEKRKRRLHANKKVFMRKRRERRDWRKRGQKEVQAERRLVEGMKIRDQQELNAAEEKRRRTRGKKRTESEWRSGRYKLD